jgi:hypothetical protein
MKSKVGPERPTGEVNDTKEGRERQDAISELDSYAAKPGFLCRSRVRAMSDSAIEPIIA